MVLAKKPFGIGRIADNVMASSTICLNPEARALGAQSMKEILISRSQCLETIPVESMGPCS